MTFSGVFGDHIESGVMQSWGLKQSRLWKLTFGGSPTETEVLIFHELEQQLLSSRFAGLKYQKIQLLQ